jgi:hypothetical protein
MKEVIDDALYSLQLLVADDASIEDFVCLGGLQVNPPGDPGRQGESRVNVVLKHNTTGCNARTSIESSKICNSSEFYAEWSASTRLNAPPLTLERLDAAPLGGAHVVPYVHPDLNYL